MKKQNIAIVIFGVLLILGGLMKVWGLSTLLLSPDALMATQEQLQQAMVASGAGQSPADAEAGRLAVQEMMQQQADFLTAPMTRIHTLLAGLMGLAAIAAGIGILMLADWGLPMVLAYAYTSLPVQIWGVFRTSSMTKGIMGSFAGALDAETKGIGNAIGGGVVIFQVVLGLFLALLWYGLVIWYFNKKTTQALFSKEPAPAGAGEGIATPEISIETAEEPAAASEPAPDPIPEPIPDPESTPEPPAPEPPLEPIPEPIPEEPKPFQPLPPGEESPPADEPASEPEEEPKPQPPSEDSPDDPPLFKPKPPTP